MVVQIRSGPICGVVGDNTRAHREQKVSRKHDNKYPAVSMHIVIEQIDASAGVMRGRTGPRLQFSE